jgi:hypothetical protein
MGIITLVTNLLDNHPLHTDAFLDEDSWLPEYLGGFKNRVWNVPLASDIVMKMPTFGALCRRVVGAGASAIGIVRNYSTAQVITDDEEEHHTFAVGGRSQVFINPDSAFTLQPGDEIILLACMTAGVQLAQLLMKTTSDKHRLQNFDVLLPDVISGMTPGPDSSGRDSADSSKPRNLLKSSTKSSSSKTSEVLGLDPLSDSGE